MGSWFPEVAHDNRVRDQVTFFSRRIEARSATASPDAPNGRSNSSGEDARPAQVAWFGP